MKLKNFKFENLKIEIKTELGFYRCCYLLHCIGLWVKQWAQGGTDVETEVERGKETLRERYRLHFHSSSTTTCWKWRTHKRSQFFNRHDSLEVAYTHTFTVLQLPQLMGSGVHTYVYSSSTTTTLWKWRTHKRSQFFNHHNSLEVVYTHTFTVMFTVHIRLKFFDYHNSLEVAYTSVHSSSTTTTTTTTLWKWRTLKRSVFQQPQHVGSGVHTNIHCSKLSVFLLRLSSFGIPRNVERFSSTPNSL